MKTATRSVLAALTLCGVALADPTDNADPQMKAVLDELTVLAPKPIVTLPPALARLQPSPADAVVQLMQTKGNLAPDKLPAVGMVEMKSIPGPTGEPLPLRVYTPPGQGPFPVIVYYHGGGWVIATLDTYDSSCRALCAGAEAVVISVDYRKAPEHKFPAAHEDCYAALQYTLANAAEFKGDPNCVAVVGESAGGNLATGVCLMAEMRGGKLPVFQGLVYPIADYNFDTPSYQENADAKPLNKPMMQWFFQQYLNGPDDGKNPIVSPLRADPEMLKKLPPATVVMAQIDPLRSEGEAYAKKLTDAGVAVQSKTYPGVTHEFFGMGLAVNTAKDAETFMIDGLKAAFKAAKAK